MTQIAVDDEAVGRLADLGLNVEQVRTVVLRADAEAKLCNGLEPPNSEGMTRYGKTVRFLREELLPQRWSYDNSGNFCRTVHPSGEFAIVASSGDEMTGVVVEGHHPSTKYPKGEATSRAIAANEQLALFDLGDQFSADRALPGESLIVASSERTWFLLYRVTATDIHLEISFPIGMEYGVIKEWEERIILPPVRRQDEPISPPQAGDDVTYSVDVAIR